jgi:predicted RNA-binding Zn-ribbon protein involved in translation (DUF1610 family)
MSDRKYRQKGYQDSDRPEKGRRRRSGPSGPRREGPRGRGLGRPTQSVFRCSACGTRITLLERLQVDATCAECGADLHTCTHCQHFDTSAPLECRQPIRQRVSPKAKRNDCELFEPRAKQEFGTESKRSPEDPRAAFDALFKK